MITAHRIAHAREAADRIYGGGAMLTIGESAAVLLGHAEKLEADNRRLRAACAAVLAKLDTYSLSGGKRDVEWAVETLSAALAAAAAGGDGGKHV